MRPAKNSHAQSPPLVRVGADLAAAPSRYGASRSIASWMAVGVAVATLIAILIGGRDLVGSSIFSWHLERPALHEGGGELLVAGLLLWWTMQRAGITARFALSAAVVALYLRHHGVDAAVLASGMYCLGLYGLGRRLDAWIYRENSPELRIVRSAGFGIGAAGLVLWLAALLFGLGFEASRVLGLATAAVGLVAWAFTAPFRDIPRARPDPLTASAYALGLVALLALMARSNTVLYYDSIWYGLRPDRVLFGNHGVYSFLGLTTQVHYYPKLYEVVLAPLQGWGDLSFVIGFNAWCLLLLFVASRGLALTCGVSAERSSVLAIMLACFPAFIGVAETSKGDILAAAMVVMAIHALQLGLQRRDPGYFSLVLIGALLASGLRLSALPWLAVLFVMTAALWGGELVRRPRTAFDWIRGRPGLMVAAVAFLTLLVHYRTWLLAGTPLITNASTQLLFDRLGWTLRYPVGALTGGEPASGLAALADLPYLALAPSLFVFHTFKWMGAAWLVAFPAALLRLFVPDRRKWLRSNAIPLTVGLAFPLLLAVNSWPSRGGDGNYFIVPAICLTCVGWSWLGKSRLADAVLVVCGALGLVAYLVTSNWVAGTTPFQMELGRAVRDERQQLSDYLSQGELNYVANFFAKCNRHTRVTGLLPETGQAFALPIRFEPLQEMAWNNPMAFTSEIRFVELMDATGTQFLVLPATREMAYLAPQLELHGFVDRTLERLIRRGDAMLVTQRGAFRIYRLLDAAPPRGCPSH